MAVSIAGAQPDAACGSGSPVGDCISRHKRPAPAHLSPRGSSFPRHRKSPRPRRALWGIGRLIPVGHGRPGGALLCGTNEVGMSELGCSTQVVLHDVAVIVGGCSLERRGVRRSNARKFGERWRRIIYRPWWADSPVGFWPVSCRTVCGRVVVRSQWLVVWCESLSSDRPRSLPIMVRPSSIPSLNWSRSKSPGLLGLVSQESRRLGSHITTSGLIRNPELRCDRKGSQRAEKVPELGVERQCRSRLGMMLARRHPAVAVHSPDLCDSGAMSCEDGHTIEVKYAVVGRSPVAGLCRTATGLDCLESAASSICL